MWKTSRNFINFSILFLLLLSCFQHSIALIVPQEVPSILSLVYSNIPPVKKGTDSRLGFGFRLGEHADFQVLIELGPQKETRPIGEKDNENSFSKRHVGQREQWALLRQQMLQQQQQQQQQQQAQSSTERTASSWLENWSKDMNAQNKKHTKSKGKQQAPSQPQRPQSEMSKVQQEQKVQLSMPTVLPMPEQAVKQLQLLYKMATTPTQDAITATTTITTPTTTTTKRPSLNLGPPAGFKPLPAEMPSQLLTIESTQKSKKQITAELMDVSLEAGD